MTDLCFPIDQSQTLISSHSSISFNMHKLYALNYVQIWSIITAVSPGLGQVAKYMVKKV